MALTKAYICYIMLQNDDSEDCAPTATLIPFISLAFTLRKEFSYSFCKNSGSSLLQSVGGASLLVHTLFWNQNN